MYDIIFKGNVMYISGTVTFYDVMNILQKYDSFMSCNFKNIIVNLRYLESSNTSMLLLMINFIKVSIKKDKVIRFIHVPDFLIELGRVYNLNKILYKRMFKGYHVKRKN